MGVKRVCANCEAKFYDLTRTPPVCPKCGTEFIVVVRPASTYRPNKKWKPFGNSPVEQPQEETRVAAEDNEDKADEEEREEEEREEDDGDEATEDDPRSDD